LTLAPIFGTIGGAGVVLLVLALQILAKVPAPITTFTSGKIQIPRFFHNHKLE
jgi:hypothetical protein